MVRLERVCGPISVIAPPRSSVAEMRVPKVVHTSELRPGVVLPEALFTRQGIRLLSAGTKLTESLCKILQSTGEPSFVFAANVSEVASTAAVRSPAAAAARVQVGAPAPENFITTGGVLALEKGQPVEQHHADALSDEDEPAAVPVVGRGRTAAQVAGRPWAVRHEELARLRATMLKTADSLVAQKQERWATLPRKMKIGVEAVPFAAADNPGWFTQAELSELRAERIGEVRRIYASLLRGTPTPVQPMREIIEELVALFSRHPRRFAGLALSGQREDDYLPDHAFTTAALCVAMAVQMRWARWEVVQAGLTGLLADVGMMLVPEAIRTARRKIDENEVNRVRRHPTHSVVLLEACPELPEVVPMAVYQHHEREDGSGYPAGVSLSRIHPIAKIAAVADVFASLSAPRPHREAMLSYHAMERVVAVASEGALDREAARSLVRVCGLFPVSSWIRLSDNTIARVIGTHLEQVDRPIVQRYAGGQPGSVVDLSTIKPWELSVLEPMQIDE